MNLKELMPSSWVSLLSEEFEKPYIKKLEEFLESEYQNYRIYPQKEDLFSTFRYTPFESVKVLLLGQDPYHGAGQAHGLSFSVPPNITFPPSLRNIFKELNTDLGLKVPNNGNLIPWAKQGILLLNAVLTVREGDAASHKNKGWEKFNDAIIKKLSNEAEPMVFLLWGNYAKKKKILINQEKHIVIEGIHPSPLSANSGFFGSKPFSTVNTALEKLGKKPINWQIPDL